MIGLPALALLGAAILVLTMGQALRYYPPGHDYDEERRRNRIAFVGSAVGIAMMAIAGCLAV